MDTTTDTSSDESYRPAKEKKYKCTHEGCTAIFSKNSKLTYHIRRHTGERPFACDVPGCHKTYLYSFHLRRHKEIHHSGRTVERIACPIEGCYMELANKYSLKKHIKLKHNPERSYPFNCYECCQGFHRKRQLLQHTYVHTGVFPFTCEICEAGFPTSRDCNRHKRTHTNYSCKCGKSFERWTQLLAHKRLCETVRPKCAVCNKTFSQRGNLKKHLELHLAEKTKMFACTYDNCTRLYLYRKNLLYHINKYHKRIPLPRIACTERSCKYTCSKKQNLLNHVRLIHSKNGVEKKARAPRKDKGTSRTSMAAVLAGLELQQPLQCAYTRRLPIKLSESVASGMPDNSSVVKKNTKTSSEDIAMLKSKLKEALLNNLNSTTAKDDSESDDNQNKTSCVKILC